MTNPVKPTRRYESPRRRQQAAATRRDILQAARRLFEERGYAATSMAAIAAEAGVSLKTAYLAFETKSGLLRALWNMLLRGDEGAAPVGERPWFRAVLDEPDPARRLRLNVRNATRVRARAGRLLDVIRDAAPHDREIEALWRRIQDEFYGNQQTVVESLSRDRALRPGLGAGRAADVLWTLNHPDVYRLLVGERGWTPARYERWLADLLCAQLLRKG
ncbi:MAG TPA: helix-turn-helix domain-containing protein [Gaiellaceae bacterium]|nr:helix-turn-helix domain-containing protein [Gaiellaceae bacterium]